VAFCVLAVMDGIMLINTPSGGAETSHLLTVRLLKVGLSPDRFCSCSMDLSVGCKVARYLRWYFARIYCIQMLDMCHETNSSSHCRCCCHHTEPILSLCCTKQMTTMIIIWC